MPITYEKVIQEVLNELGAVKGATAATAETNYAASPATSTVFGPDFTPAMVKDAVAVGLGETVEDIASTPLHPERAGFTTQTAALAYDALIPRVDSVGNKIIGVIGEVRDGADATPLLNVTMDSVRGWKIFAGNVYDGFIPYLYAISGNRILHTRTTVVIDVCTYARPTSFNGNIPLDDWHEGGLVARAVRILATKESMFADLYAAANTRAEAHVAKIKKYGESSLYGRAGAT